MESLIIGAGLMGRAIAYDLCKFSNFENISIIDKDKKTLSSAEQFLQNKDVNFNLINLEKSEDIKNHFQKNDICISAIPYTFNSMLSRLAVETKTHFLDLGGNNTVVSRQKTLSKEAEKNDVTIIPDCGLAPGMTSVIVRDLVETLGNVKYVKIRVGGLPIKPKPPLNYQIVFSPNGLVNEYVEDAIVLKNGKIIQKKSMTELEEITFPEPFGKMEAFVTSGGCSTLPYTYRDKIEYLDYKTVRYLGHCKEFKPLLNIKPRVRLIEYLHRNLPTNQKDVVLVKVLSKSSKEKNNVELDYSIIDYYDEENNITSMMRTTAFPTSIIAQLIEQNKINKRGVFCSEEIVEPNSFFKELEKRNIIINKDFK